MANRFWVAGDGTWDGNVGLKWSTTSGGVGGASVPTSVDDVFFDGGSDVGGVAFDVTVAAGNTGCRDVTASGVVAGSGFTIDSPLTVSGKFNMTAGSAFGALSNNSTITFDGSGSGLIIGWVQAGTRGAVVFDGTGSFDVFGFQATTLTLTRGTIVFKGSSKISSLSSSNSNTRGITWPVSGITTLTVDGTGTVWETTNTTGLTVTPLVGSRIRFAPTATGNVTVNAGSSGLRLVGIIAILQSGANIITFNNVNCEILDLATLTLADTNITIRGALTINAGVTLSGNTGTITFAGTATLSLTGTITRHFDINGSGITVTLSASLNLGSDNDLKITNGNLTSGGNAITCRAFLSNSTSARTVNIGTSSLVLKGSGAILNINSANLTLTSSGTITSDYTGALARTMTVAGSAVTFGSLNVTGGTGNFTIIGNTSTEIDLIFTGSVNFTGFSGALQDGSFRVDTDLTISTGMSLSSGNGTIEFQGASVSTLTTNGKTLNRGITCSKSSGTAELNLADALNTGTGALVVTQGKFNTVTTKAVTCSGFISDGANTRTANLGSGFTITGSGTVFDTNPSTNLTLTVPLTITFNHTGSNSRTADFGGKSLNNVSVTGGNGTFTMNNGTVGDLTWTGFSGTWAHPSTGLAFTGNLTLASGMLTSGSGTLTFTGSNSKNMNSNGVTLTFPLTIDSTSNATLSLTSALSIQGALTLTKGSLNSGNFNITCSTFSAGIDADVLTMGSGTWTITGTSVATVWDVGQATNLWVKDSTGAIKLTGSTANTRTVDFGIGLASLLDSSGNGRTLTKLGFNPKPEMESAPFAKFGEGVKLFDDSVRRQDSAFILNGDLSITMNFDLDDNVSRGLTMSIDFDAGAGLSFAVFTSSTNNVVYEHSDGTTTTAFTSASAISTGYHTLTLTRNASTKTVVIKIDGTTFIDGTYTVNPGNMSGAVSLYVGFVQNFLSMRGTIYEYRVWGSLIAQATLDSIVSSSGTSTAEGTEVAYWKFDHLAQYNNFWISNATANGRVDVNGEPTFNDFKSDTILQQIRFAAGKITTVNTWSINGASGSVITLDTITSSGTFTIIKNGGGFIGAKFHSITRSTASPVNTWYADSNSTNGGTNTNWIFGDAITVDCRQYIDYFITRNKRNYFLVVPGVQFIFNPDNETDANDNFTDTGQTADATKASLRTHIKLFTF